MTIPPAPHEDEDADDAPPALPELTPTEQRKWSTLVHAGGILFGVLPALIGYFLLRGRGTFAQDSTVAALNFQLTLLVAYVVGGLLSIAAVGLVIIVVALVLNVVFSIIAATRTNRGATYVYPLAVRFIG